MCSNLMVKQLRRSGDFIVKSKHIEHLFLEFLLLNLNRQMFAETLYMQCQLKYRLNNTVLSIQ